MGDTCCHFCSNYQLTPLEEDEGYPLPGAAHDDLLRQGFALVPLDVNLQNHPLCFYCCLGWKILWVWNAKGKYWIKLIFIQPTVSRGGLHHCSFGKILLNVQNNVQFFSIQMWLLHSPISDPQSQTQILVCFRDDRISRFGWIGSFPKIHSTYPIIPNRRMLLLLFVCRLGRTGWTIFTDQDFCHRDGINWGKRRLKGLITFCGIRTMHNHFEVFRLETLLCVHVDGPLVAWVWDHRVEGHLLVAGEGGHHTLSWLWAVPWA